MVGCFSSSHSIFLFGKFTERVIMLATRCDAPESESGVEGTRVEGFILCFTLREQITTTTTTEMTINHSQETIHSILQWHRQPTRIVCYTSFVYEMTRTYLAVHCAVRVPTNRRALRIRCLLACEHCRHHHFPIRMRTLNVYKCVYSNHLLSSAVLISQRNSVEYKALYHTHAPLKPLFLFFPFLLLFLHQAVGKFVN